MRSLILLITIYLNCSFLTFKPEQIIIKPGKEIRIDKNVFRLKHSTSKEVLNAFELEDFFYTTQVHWDGIDGETGESIFGYEFEKEISYKGINFIFTGPKKDSLILEEIEIKKTEFYDVHINNKIKLGDSNPPLDRYFKIKNKYDHISSDSLTYNLYSRGISFYFTKNKKEKILNEVDIHWRIK